ncbi:MAG: Crp/Fnr family transcriptional regulator [Flavobacteriales bacterium]
MGKFDLLKQNITSRLSISDEEWDDFSAQLEEASFGKKEFLLRAGEVDKYMTFILKGVTRTYFTDEHLHEHIYQIGFEDWWCGDMMSMITGKPAHYSVQALEDTYVARMPVETFNQMLDKHFRLDRFFRILLQGAYIANQTRTIDTMSKSAEQRYLAFTKKHPQLELRVAQQHIASYLGITPEALSRIKRGIIEKSRTH